MVYLHRPPDLATLRKGLRQQRRHQQGGSASQPKTVQALQSAEGVAAEAEAHSREDATYAAPPSEAAPVDLQVRLPYSSLFASSCYRRIAAQQCTEPPPGMPSHDYAIYAIISLHYRSGHNNQPLEPHRKSILCQKNCCNDHFFELVRLYLCQLAILRSSSPQGKAESHSGYWHKGPHLRRPCQHVWRSWCGRATTLRRCRLPPPHWSTRTSHMMAAPPRRTVVYLAGIGCRIR